MGKVGGVEQMLDDLREWKNGTLSKSVEFCTKFARRVALLACHLALINTPLGLTWHIFLGHVCLNACVERPQWLLRGLLNLQFMCPIHQ
jgi:hypothetical protein